VFIDGNHAAPFVVQDSKNAMKLCKRGGLILWHDYGEWPDVTAVLDRDYPGARLIAGTSLAMMLARDGTLTALEEFLIKMSLNETDQSISKDQNRAG